MRRISLVPMRRRLLLPLVLLAAHPLSAQDATFVRYGDAEGFAIPSARRLTEDRRGFVWVGTEHDLYRFDGVRARRYAATPATPGTLRGTLRGSVVHGLAPDLQGDGVYVWTAAGGLQHVDPATDRVTPVSTAPLLMPGESFVYTMQAATDGSLWFATTHGAMRRAPDGHVRRVPTDGAPEVVDVAPGPDGRVWLVSPDALHAADRHGLARLVLRATHATGALASVAVRPDGSAVVGALGGLFEDRGGRWHRLADVPRAGVLAVDRRGTVWATGAGTLVRVDGRRALPLPGTRAPDGLPVGPVSALLIGRRGTLWAAVGGQLVARAPSSGVLRWEHDAALGDAFVLQAMQEKGGPLWVGTLGAGVLRCTARGCRPIPGVLAAGKAESLLRMPDGSLYVAGYTDGLVCAARGTARLHACPGPPNPRVLALGPDGRIWSTTADSGLYVRGPDGADRRWRAFPTARTGTADRLGALTKAVLPLPGGQAWVGTLGNGLYLAHDARNGPIARRLPLSPGSGEALRVVSLARQGDTLYAATLERGIARIVGAEGPQPIVRWIDATRGLPSDQVAALAQDRHGRVWAFGPRGAALVRPDATAQGFTAADGWPAVIVPWDGVRRAPDGRLLVATSAGLLSFDPDALSAPAPPPPVYLTAVRVRGQPRLADATHAPLLRLRHDENVVSIDLAAGDAGPVRPWTYAYRLVRRGEAMPAWQSLGTRATLDLAGIAPGRYRLDVRTDLAGRTSPVRSMAFVVAPPWWQTLWFRLLIVLGAVALLAAAYRARVAHLLALDRTRRRIADDLHDDLGSKLASLATQLDVADLIAASTGAPTGRHAASARSLVGDLGDAVWLIDAHADRLDRLADKIERVARSVLPAGECRLRVGVLPPLPMPSEARRHILLAVREMLHNAARHGAAPYTLAVELGGTAATPTLRIRLAHPCRDPDAPPVPTGGRGLDTLRRRADALGGTFALNIGPDGATSVLTMPLPRPARWRQAWTRLRRRKERA